MCLLFETIKIQERNACNLAYHQERFERSCAEIFGVSGKIFLEEIIKIPPTLGNSLHRCRISFGEKIEKIEFFPYETKHFKKIKIVEKPEIEYAFKFEDRANFQQLLKENSDFDEVIISQNGFLTDATFANLVFFDGSKWFTPNTFLLKGTKRSYLLDNQLITEEEIKVFNLKKFKKIALINAMRDLDLAMPIDIISY